MAFAPTDMISWKELHLDFSLEGWVKINRTGFKFTHPNSQLKAIPLRVVQTQAILFLKSVSEKGGSDIERLKNWICRSPQNRLKIPSLKFRVVLCRIRLFPTLISEINWLGSELPLKFSAGDSTLIFVSEPTRISDMDSNTKSGEPNIPTSQENITQLCKGQCGFFGTADNQGFCSVSKPFKFPMSHK